MEMIRLQGKLWECVSLIAPYYHDHTYLHVFALMQMIGERYLGRYMYIWRYNRDLV